ncbi:MAG TPA: hypothetical protein VGS41_16990, partial [Chthonomonadales bacterium]|nr:hypothetical protein [Chthonomonadales bacterium]
RYDGRLRSGLTNAPTASWGYSGNPFGDDECGKFYARAMSVWSLLLACQGFIYDGPAGRIGFRPVWRPADHASFFTAAEGWGLFRSRTVASRTTARIRVAWGQLVVREIILKLPAAANSVTVSESGVSLPAAMSSVAGEIRLSLTNEHTVRAGKELEIRVQHGAI